MGTYLSFLIRLWCEEWLRPFEPVAWKVQIESIQSGRQWSFDTLEEALAFLRQQAEDAASPQTPEV